MIGTDLSGRIQYWNGAATELYGFTAAEAIGAPLTDVVGQPGDHQALAQWSSRLRAGVPHAGDWLVRDKGGRVFTAHLILTPVRDDQDLVVGSVAVSYDASLQRESDARLRQLAAIVDGSDDAIMEAGPDGIIRFANPAVERVFGYQPGELLGRDISILVPDERADEKAAAVASVLAGRPVGVLATQRRRKDGSLINTTLNLSPVRDGSGVVIGVSGATRDVTAETQLREALEASERRYRARFEQAGMPQAVADLQGRLVTVNDALCKLLGRAREQLEGLDVRRLSHPSESIANDRLSGVLEGRVDADSWERVLARGDGEPLSVLVHATLLRSADGTPEGLAAFVVDLSALRHAESALIRREAKFAAFALRTSEWVLVMDEAGTLLHVSPAVERLLGYDPAAITGRNGWDFVHPDELEGTKQAFDSVLATPGSSQIVEFRMSDVGGRWRWVEQAFTNCMGDPDIAGVVCNGRDVTARVLAEQALRESEARYRAIAETRREHWR